MNGNPFLPGESHGQRSLAGYIVHGVAELDLTDRLSLSLWSFPPIVIKTYLSGFYY